MIILSLVFVFCGVVLLLFAFRGRIVERGQFCKRCKFNLAGLDLAQHDIKCPECGRAVHQGSARRALLRRRSRTGLIIAAILLIAGLGTMGVWASGNASAVLKPLPDWAVVGLTDLGMDAALDELVVRVSRTTNPMSDSQLNHVIEAGLKHQANLSAAFDPRWGEVLYVTCVEGQMSDEQLKQYMLTGVSVDVLIRDRVHQGAKQIDSLMKISPTRLDALTGGNTGYTVETKWVADGVVGQDARKSSNAYSPSALVRATRGGWWVNSAPSPIVPTGDALNGKVGSKLNIYSEYEIVLRTPSDGYPASFKIPDQELEENLVIGTVRTEHEVEIIDQSEPIVPVVDDSELAQRTCEAMSILPIHLLKVVPDPKPYPLTTLLTMSTQSMNLPANIAIRAFLRLDDGEEILIGQWVAKGSMGNSMSGIQWSVDNGNAKEQSEAQAIVDKLFEQGHVDVIFRTDATLAEFSPEIDQVIGLTILFKDVPIEPADDVSMISSSTGDKWINGKCEGTPEPQEPTQP